MTGRQTLESLRREGARVLESVARAKLTAWLRACIEDLDAINGIMHERDVALDEIADRNCRPEPDATSGPVLAEAALRLERARDRLHDVLAGLDELAAALTAMGADCWCMDCGQPVQPFPGKLCPACRLGVEYCELGEEA